MDPLTWYQVALLVSRVGLEVTDFIVRKANANAVVTIEEWDALLSLSAKTPQSQLRDAITRAGLPPGDERVKALLDMIK